MATLQGRRCANKTLGEPGDGDWPKNPGDYALVDRYGVRYLHFVDPFGHPGACNPQIHQIVDEPDGTITVSPSILDKAPPEPAFHGFLKHGVWNW